MNGEILVNQPISQELEDIQAPSLTDVGAETFVGLLGDNQVNTGFTVDVPSMEPITDLQLDIAPAVMQKQYGFTWDSDQIWSNNDATKNGAVVTSNGSLTGTAAGTIWDFNNGAQGWTFSNSYSGIVTSPACGYNGSSGGSLPSKLAPHTQHLP